MLENIPLSQKQKQVIIGGLLGDGYCNINRKLIRFGQRSKQEEYLKYKYSFFNSNEKSRIYRRDYKQGYVGYSFELKNPNHKYDELYKYLKKHLYSNEGRKKISPSYLENLTPFGLAIWWMDDGSLCKSPSSRWGKLCTECFNYEEHILLQKYFKKKWDIDVKITQEKHKYFFINLNATSLRKLIKIIYPYMLEVPSMLYKIDMDYKVIHKNFEDFKEIHDKIKEVRNSYFNLGIAETTGGTQ